MNKLLSENTKTNPTKLLIGEGRKNTFFNNYPRLVTPVELCINI